MKKTTKKRGKKKITHKRAPLKRKISRAKKPAKRKTRTAKKRPAKQDLIRMSTNIPGFDKLVEGGFEKNTTNLVVGNAGSGKTIFATQFLMSGLKKGERCLYVTFEERKKNFYENMKRFGWDLEEYEKRGLFTFLEYTPIKVKAMLEEGGGTIEGIIIKKKVSRMVIDSITSFALLFDDELEKREAALDLFNMINDWNCTALLTYEGEPVQGERAETQTIEFESDSITLFYYIREGGERHRYIEILKMRGTAHSKKIHRFHIGNSGIVVYSKPIRKLNIG